MQQNMYGYGSGQSPVEIHIRNGSVQSQNNMGGQVPYTNQPFNNGNGVSQFTGTLSGYIGTEILVYLIIALSMVLSAALIIGAVVVLAELESTLLLVLGILLAIVFALFIMEFGTSWAICVWKRWMAKHTRIDGRQIVFDGKAIQLFGCSIKWGFFTIITFGIYSWWVPLKMTAWSTSHTHLE